jgi:hypothetical protein
MACSRTKAAALSLAWNSSTSTIASTIFGNWGGESEENGFSLPLGSAGFALASMAAADRSDNFAARLELEHEPTSTILRMVQREGSGFTLVVGDVLGCFPGSASGTPAACFLVSLSSPSTSVFGHQSIKEEEDDEDDEGCVKRRTTLEQSSGVSGLLFQFRSGDHQSLARQELFCVHYVIKALGTKAAIESFVPHLQLRP